MDSLSKTSETVRTNEKIFAYEPARSTIKRSPLSWEELRKIDAYWRASRMGEVKSLSK